VDYDRANRWLTLVANIGILIGLALIIVEIRQNAELLRLQFINDDLQETSTSLIPMLGDDLSRVMMKSIFSPEEMTYAEFMVVDSWLTQQIARVERRYQLGQEGILDETAWKSMDFNYEWHFGNKFARLWWQHEARSAYSYAPEFVDHVDKKISDLPSNTSTRGWSTIQAELLRKPVD